MTATLGVGEVTALLLDERKYDTPLRAKTFHKLLYFADKELRGVGIDTDVDHFWYKFGTMAKTGGTPVTIDRSDEGSAVDCDLEVENVGLEEDELTKARLAVSRTLNRHYGLGTEGLTDLMYEEAPYDLQRHYRHLDKQLSNAIDSRPDVEDVESDPESVRETMFDLTDSFPADDYPRLEDDLYLWYSNVSAELDEYEYQPSKILKISELFWTLFCIDLAQRENTGLSEEEIAEELDTDDLDERQEKLRKRLQVYERERCMMKEELDDDPVVTEAADGVAMSMLDFASAE